MRTMVILNPHAANGRTLPAWRRVQPILARGFGVLQLEQTESAADVPAIVAHAHERDYARIVSIGGDGTNNSVVNAIVQYRRQQNDAPSIPLGIVPVGSGGDWGRGLNLPKAPEHAAHRVVTQAPRLIDCGQLNERYFLNISSVGLGGIVAERVNQLEKRPWTYLQATVASILSFQPPAVSIYVDDVLWYSGEIFACVVANGQVFGHGMRIAPRASFDDRLFDVVLVPQMPRVELLAALRRVYSATHLSHPKVRYVQGRQVRVTVTDGSGSLPVEADGEQLAVNAANYTLHPHRLEMLI